MALVELERKDLRDGVGGDLVSLAVDLLDGRVVGVLVGNEESGLDVAAVGILALAVEHLLVQVDVVVVDGVVERHHHHLRHLLRLQFARHFCARLGTEAVGQEADGRVARRGSVGIRVQICRHKEISNVIEINQMNSFCTARVLVGAVGAIGNAVTEEAALDASAVVTGEHSLLAEGLIGGQDGLDFADLFLDQAVLHLLFPVASLFLDVESQTGRATNGLQSL